MYMRFYANVEDTVKAMEFYKDVFFGIPNKNAGQRQGHNSIKLFDKDELNILIYGPRPKQTNGGVLIIRFLDNEADIFKKANKRIEQRDDIILDYFMRDYLWGTTITRFTDPFGYSWALEIKTEAL